MYISYGFWPSDMEGNELYITCQNDEDIDEIELPYTTDEYQHPKN